MIAFITVNTRHFYYPGTHEKNDCLQTQCKNISFMIYATCEAVGWPAQCAGRPTTSLVAYCIRKKHVKCLLSVSDTTPTFSTQYYGSSTPVYLYPGDRVIRGPDWKWGDQVTIYKKKKIVCQMRTEKNLYAVSSHSSLHLASGKFANEK